MTDMQQKVYDQIKAWDLQYPQAPITVLELSKMFGISRQAVNDHVMQLEIAGLVKRTKGITLVK